MDNKHREYIIHWIGAIFVCILVVIVVAMFSRDSRDNTKEKQITKREAIAECGQLKNKDLVALCIVNVNDGHSS